MSGLVLLCILPEDAAVSAEKGMEFAALPAAPVEALPLPPLTLWIRPAAHAPAATLEDVRAHHEIVAGAWSAFPAVLPVRLGQWFATPAALAAAVEPRVDAYLAALDRVRDAGEFSIRIVEPGRVEPGPAEAGGSGTAYLKAAAERARRRAEDEKRGRRVAGQLAERLSGLLKGERVDPLPTAHGLATVAHLVARAREEEYRAAVDAFAAERPDLRLLRTGPWPAWSFTA